MNPYETVEFAGILLLIVGLARLLTARLDWPVWYASSYTLIGLLMAVGTAYLSDWPFRSEVFFVALAAVSGVTWTGLVQNRRGLPRERHWISLCGAMATSGTLAIVATNYEWWIAPITVAALFAHLGTSTFNSFEAYRRKSNPML